MTSFLDFNSVLEIHCNFAVYLLVPELVGLRSLKVLDEFPIYFISQDYYKSFTRSEEGHGAPKASRNWPLVQSIILLRTPTAQQ